MKYFLVLTKRNEIIKQIDWNTITGYSDYNVNSLHDICEFTADFNNLEEIKEVLLHMGLISLEDYENNNELAIIYTYKKENKKLMYGITYTKDIKFFDVEYLRAYLLSNRNNIELMTKLCNHYRNNPLVLGNIASIRNYINNVKLGYQAFDIENELVDFICKIAYKYDNKNHCYQKDNEGNMIENTKPLRDLAMFLSYDYHKELKRKELLNKKQALMAKKEEKTLERKRVNNSNQQVSFFDDDYESN